MGSRGGCRKFMAGESVGRGCSKGQGRRKSKVASDAHESAKDANFLAQVMRVVFRQDSSGINCSVH